MGLDTRQVGEPGASLLQGKFMLSLDLSFFREMEMPAPFLVSIREAVA